MCSAPAGPPHVWLSLVRSFPIFFVALLVNAKPNRCSVPAAIPPSSTLRSALIPSPPDCSRQVCLGRLDDGGTAASFLQAALDRLAAEEPAVDPEPGVSSVLEGLLPPSVFLTQKEFYEYVARRTQALAEAQAKHCRCGAGRCDKAWCACKDY